MTTEARKRLHDIRLAAGALARFTNGKTVETLKADEILQAAVERKLEIIGEAFVQLRTEDPATADYSIKLRRSWNKFMQTDKLPSCERRGAEVHVLNALSNDFAKP